MKLLARLYDAFGRWLIRVLACGLVLVLAACALASTVKPIPADCNAIGFLACTPNDHDTGVRWSADPARAEAWDKLPEQVVAPLSTRLLTCETRRLALEQCLVRLERAHAITLNRPTP